MKKKTNTHPTRKAKETRAAPSPKKTKATWPELRIELHQKILEGLTNHQIAVHFQVSQRTVVSWKRALSRELMAQENFEKLTWISEQIASLELARAEAFKNYGTAIQQRDDKLAFSWLSSALKAQAALNDLYSSCGALDDKPLSKAKILQRKKDAS